MMACGRLSPARGGRDEARAASGGAERREHVAAARGLRENVSGRSGTGLLLCSGAVEAMAGLALRTDIGFCEAEVDGARSPSVASWPRPNALRRSPLWASSHGRSPRPWTSECHLPPYARRTHLPRDRPRRRGRHPDEIGDAEGSARARGPFDARARPRCPGRRGSGAPCRRDRARPGRRRPRGGGGGAGAAIFTPARAARHGARRPERPARPRGGGRRCRDRFRRHAAHHGRDLPALRAPLAEGAAVAVLGFEAADPTGYGRLIAQDGRLAAIREHRDASAEERPSPSAMPA